MLLIANAPVTSECDADDDRRLMEEIRLEMQDFMPRTPAPERTPERLTQGRKTKTGQKHDSAIGHAVNDAGAHRRNDDSAR